MVFVIAGAFFLQEIFVVKHLKLTMLFIDCFNLISTLYKNTFGYIMFLLLLIQCFSLTVLI